MDLLDLLIWSLPGPLPDPGTLVSTSASLGPGESGPHLGLTRPGDFVTHVDLIAVDSFLASPGTGDSDPICASTIPGDSGPYLGIIGTWFHCMACRLASPGLRNSGPYLGIIGKPFLCIAYRLASPGPGEWG